jgi:hypothetical protein
MATITLNFKTDQTQRAIDRLKSQARAIAIPRALNRSIASAKTAMVRVISEDTTLKAKDVRDKIWVGLATADSHVARLYASPKKIPLIQFNAKGPNPSRGRGRVTTTLSGARKSYPGMFIATMPSGHIGVFGRSATKFMQAGPHGGRRPAIFESFGPSIMHVFMRHQAIGIARAQEQLVKNLNSEFRFALQQTA